MPGRTLCGTLRVADIGIDAAVLDRIRPTDFANEPALWGDAFPMPRLDGHKYHRGHAVVVSGGMTRTGAARLAARGALRAGAGLVTLASPPEALAVNAAQLTAIMLERMEGPAGLAAILADRRRNAVCLGPALGTGEAARALVAEALASGAATVIDADGLTAFAEAPDALFAGIRAWPERPVVLTPHAGEFARLFGVDPAASKRDAAKKAAERSGAVVVVKGPDTVVAMPDGAVSIAANAPPWLATAGPGTCWRAWSRACSRRDAGLRGGERGGLVAWRSGAGGGDRADRRGPPRGIAPGAGTAEPRSGGAEPG